MAADLRAVIAEAELMLADLNGQPSARPKRSKLSAAGRARIQAAQRKRWAKARAGKS